MKQPTIDKFIGLRNTVRPERQPLGALSTANNVILDDSAGVQLRPGYTQSLVLSGITDAYEHRSRNYAIVLAAGTLYTIDAFLGKRTLGTGYTDTTFSWAQVEDRILFVGANDAGVIVNGQSIIPLRFPDTTPPTITTLNGSMPAGQYRFAVVYRHISSGAEGPASDALSVTTTSDCAFSLSAIVPDGYEADIYVSISNDTAVRYLTTTTTGVAFYDHSAEQLGHEIEAEQFDSSVMPDGVCAIEIHQSRLHVAIYDQTSNTTILLPSRPFFYHLFDTTVDGFAVIGKVLSMMSAPDGLVIGTDVGIWLATDEGLSRLASYGVVPGKPFAKDSEGNIVIWTVRGLVKFSDGFVNLFIDKLSVVPGSTCVVAIADMNGAKQAIALTDNGGTAYNAY